MASKDRIKLFFGAGLALAVGAVFADTTVVSQTFEVGATNVGTWSGDGTVTAETITPKSIGNDVVSPIPSESASAKVLVIAGEVTCTSTTASESTTASGNYVVSDFLVNITEGSDGELTTPDSESGVQIAVAAGPAETTTIPLYVYCIPKPDDSSDDPSTDPTWVNTGIPIDTAKWHRLTLVFDYTKNTCQVNWDGVPVATSAGYLDSDPASTKNTDGGTQIAGSWYKLAKDNSASIATLKFVGAASIDDVLVKQGTKTEVSPSYGESAVATVNLDGTDVSIPVKDLSEWGVGGANITTAKIDDSGLTVAEKLAAGLEPGYDTKFEPTGMTLDANGAPTITFPGSATAKHGVQPSYAVTVTDGSGEVFDGATATIDKATGDGMQAAITFQKEPPAVLKFKITATATAPATNEE